MPRQRKEHLAYNGITKALAVEYRYERYELIRYDDGAGGDIWQVEDMVFGGVLYTSDDFGDALCMLWKANDDDHAHLPNLGWR